MEYEDRIIELNGVKFQKVKDFKYRTQPYKIVDKIANPPKDWKTGPGLAPYDLSLLRDVLRKDLWLIVYFVLKVPIANHPFVIQACYDVMDGPKSHTIDLWAREHFKSTIITIAETIQRIINNPEERICIFSHTKSAALSFFRSIKYVFEHSDILKACYPDILYQDPATQAWKWSEDAGLYVQRKSNSKEPTLMAAGLIEGMPTGYHFTGRIYDDVETFDMVKTPEIMMKLKEAFDMSQNLGTVDGWTRVVGTPYHHEGLLLYVINKKDTDGTPIYYTRKKPATVDGTPNAPSVYLPETKLAELRTNKQHFYSQQLLDPTPQGTQKLTSSHLKEVPSDQIPSRLFRFMAIDPAGERKDRVGDSWAIIVGAFEPYRDDAGAANLYILDAMIEPMTQADAMDNIVKMYMRNGKVLKLGIEKVGMSTAEIHVANALRAKGRSLTVENKGLVILRPAGRQKAQRIEASLAWPLNNGKIHISMAIPEAYRTRLKLEMDKFPYWHDDGLDAVAYLYDVAKEYKFGPKVQVEPEAEERLKIYTPGKVTNDGWMIV